ncbi:unnamed protein product [Closterium sp. Naga37s-1]|nr:unnamed protein product [Closterium sp. Naga37s-1]
MLSTHSFCLTNPSEKVAAESSFEEGSKIEWSCGSEGRLGDGGAERGFELGGGKGGAGGGLGEGMGEIGEELEV